MPSTVDILGIPLHRVTMDEAVEQIGSFVEEGRPRLVITLGAEMVMNARQHARFREAAQGADLLVPDSVGVVWAARRQGFARAEKVAGIELIPRLAEVGVGKGWRFFFLGGKPGVAEEAAARLVERFPGLEVAGCHHGYFQDEGPVIEAIRKARPHVLLAALGSPRQELWCREHEAELGVPVSIGVGGSFDVMAGHVKRAPRWMIRLGLEWLYRLVSDPSRAKRMMVLPVFAMLVIKSSASASGRTERVRPSGDEVR